MNLLVTLAAGVSEAPTRTFLPTPNLPYTWMKVAYLMTLYVVFPLWMAIHAWIFLYQRRNFMPPYIVLRLQQWWYGIKPGQRFPGLGKPNGKAHS